MVPWTDDDWQDLMRHAPQPEEVEQEVDGDDWWQGDDDDSWHEVGGDWYVDDDDIGCDDDFLREYESPIRHALGRPWEVLGISKHEWEEMAP